MRDFKKSDGLLCQRKPLRFQFVEDNHELWPVSITCQVLKVSRSAFYKWRAAKGQPEAPAQVKRQTLLNKITIIRRLPNMDNYGSLRMHRQLLKEHVKCARNTVAKIMKQAGFRSASVRKFRPTTTNSNHSLPVAPNRIGRQFVAPKPNQVWLTDFTYIPTREGFTYLCAVEDLCSRRIVGWATSRSIDANLALEALNQAIALRVPDKGLIVHSDRGSQFASNAYRERLESRSCLQSMSRKADCYDNAPMESFFKSFKAEEVYRKEYQSHEHATQNVVDYIDRFYNPIRLHSSLDYVSPIEHEGRLAAST